MKGKTDAFTRGGFFPELGDWSFPYDEGGDYAEGLSRGGFLVSVSVSVWVSIDDATHDPALDIRDDKGSIDMDKRAELWRTEGWKSAHSNKALATSQHDRNNPADADIDHEAAASREVVFEADSSRGAATGANV